MSTYDGLFTIEREIEFYQGVMESLVCEVLRRTEAKDKGWMENALTRIMLCKDMIYEFKGMEQA